jgi:hypothetical protein
VTGYRLVRLSGPFGPAEWSLRARGQTVVGRRDTASDAVDVDLSPDRMVSRQHAGIWFQNDTWWIKDLNSKHGTTLATRRIPAGRAVRCEPGVAINVGTTELTIFPPDWHRLRHGSLAIEIGLTPRFSCALALSNVPLVTRLVLRNWGNTAAPAGRLELVLADAGRATVSVPRLAPGETDIRVPPVFNLDERTLLHTRRNRWCPLTVALDGQRIEAAAALGCNLLAYNEWSYDAEHRPSLGAFVLPDHPLVIDVTRAATTGLPLQAGGPGTLQWVYDHLATRWQIDYRRDRPATKGMTQRLRLVPDVLWNPAGRAGEGTCIELALLLAACLEVMRVHPLLALVDMGSSWHALAGCWLAARRRLDILPEDREALLEDALWVDPNGCTRDPVQRAEFLVASDRARRDLTERRLVFALDVAAARSGGIQPLPLGRGPLHTEGRRGLSRRSWLRPR